MESTNGDDAVKQAAAGAQQAAGDLLAAAEAKAGATAKELGDRAQQLYGDFVNVVRESTLERPFSALAIAAGVGFMLGALHAANRSRPVYIRDGERTTD
jgi:ElaB/YqjD/DUF883 family membrane-anchored ribosome-binding protein